MKLLFAILLTCLLPICAQSQAPVSGSGTFITLSSGAALSKSSRKVTSSTYNLISCGDSISIFTGTVTKPYIKKASELLLSNRSITATYKPFGLSGYSWNYTYSVGPWPQQTLTTLLSSQVLSELDSSMTNIVVGFAGTNGMWASLGNHSAATEFADFQTWRAAVLAKGLPPANLIVVTCLPRQDDSAFDTKRATYNASLISDAATYGYKIANAGADASIGVNGAEDDTTYYQSDKIHLNDAGQSVLGTLVYNQIP